MDAHVSPAKMWIGGLTSPAKAFLHLHTQFNRDLPWDKIDMDFMNLNQAAHGDREAGFLHTRLRLNRKVVVGHWTDPEVQAGWRRGCAAPRRGMTCRGRSSPALATTCATSPSPRETRSPRRRSSGFRSMAMAWAIWSS